MRHAGPCHNVVQFQRWVSVQLPGIPALSCELPSGSSAAPQGIHLLHLLDDLKQPGPSGYAVGFQGRGDGETDGLVCPAVVRHNQMRAQRIQPPVYAFHGGIEAFQVNGNVLSPAVHNATLLPNTNICSISLYEYGIVLSSGDNRGMPLF